MPSKMWKMPVDAQNNMAQSMPIKYAKNRPHMMPIILPNLTKDARKKRNNTMPEIMMERRVNVSMEYFLSKKLRRIKF